MTVSGGVFTPYAFELGGHQNPVVYWFSYLTAFDSGLHRKASRRYPDNHIVCGDIRRYYLISRELNGIGRTAHGPRWTTLDWRLPAELRTQTVSCGQNKGWTDGQQVVLRRRKDTTIF